MSRKTLPAFCLAALLATTVSAHAADTLAHIKQSGQLRCGNIAEQDDFEKRDSHGNVGRFGTEMCHALAAAVLGGTTGLIQQGYPDGPHGLEALRTGKIDVLYGVSPYRDWAWHYGVAYGQPVFYDGQSFLVHVNAGIASLADLAGKQVCFIANTPAEQAATTALHQANIAFKPFPFEEMGEMQAALVDGHCQAQAGDATALAAGRTGFHSLQQKFIILPERLTLDPYVPAIPANDTVWARVVDAVFFALVQAEIQGVTQANVTQREGSADRADQLLLRRRGSGFTLGLPDGWVTQVIKTVGNYGELYNRTLGPASDLRLPPGANAPWSKGGLLWAPPAE